MKSNSINELLSLYKVEEIENTLDELMCRYLLSNPSGGDAEQTYTVIRYFLRALKEQGKETR